MSVETLQCLLRRTDEVKCLSPKKLTTQGNTLKKRNEQNVTNRIRTMNTGYFCPERLKHFTQNEFLTGPRTGQRIITLDKSITVICVLFYFLIRDTRRELHLGESYMEVQRPEDIVYL